MLLNIELFGKMCNEIWEKIIFIEFLLNNVWAYIIYFCIINFEQIFSVLSFVLQFFDYFLQSCNIRFFFVQIILRRLK